MKFLNYLPLLLVFLLTNCDEEKDNIIPSDGETYRIDITFNWTSSNHTTTFGDFPNNDLLNHQDVIE